MSVPPQRIRLSRKKGFNLQAASQALNGLPAVNVARPGPFGNPFRVNGYDIKDATEAVDRFRARVVGFELDGKFLKASPHPESYFGRMLATAHQLRGKNLACWCALDAPCHADVLLELANPNPEGWLQRDLNAAREEIKNWPKNIQPFIGGKPESGA